jgi:hypothetical protein
MLYSTAVSAFYAVLWVFCPRIAEALLVGFIALLLVPAVISERRRWKNR